MTAHAIISSGFIVLIVCRFAHNISKDCMKSAFCVQCVAILMRGQTSYDPTLDNAEAYGIPVVGSCDSTRTDVIIALCQGGLRVGSWACACTLVQMSPRED